MSYPEDDQEVAGKSASNWTRTPRPFETELRSSWDDKVVVEMSRESWEFLRSLVESVQVFRSTQAIEERQLSFVAASHLEDMAMGQLFCSLVENHQGALAVRGPVWRAGPGFSPMREVSGEALVFPLDTPDQSRWDKILKLIKELSGHTPV